MLTCPFTSLFKAANFQPRLPSVPIRQPDPSQKCSHFLSILSLKLLIFSSGCLPSLSGSRTLPDGLGYKPYVRFYELPKYHQILFAKLLSHHTSQTSKPPDSIRKTALPPRPNDPESTRFYSHNCSPTTPQRPRNH